MSKGKRTRIKGRRYEVKKKRRIKCKRKRRCKIKKICCKRTRTKIKKKEKP